MADKLNAHIASTNADNHARLLESTRREQQEDDRDARRHSEINSSTRSRKRQQATPTVSPLLKPPSSKMRNPLALTTTLWPLPLSRVLPRFKAGPTHTPRQPSSSVTPIHTLPTPKHSPPTTNTLQSFANSRKPKYVVSWNPPPLYTSRRNVLSTTNFKRE